jgi:hypothetical protein
LRLIQCTLLYGPDFPHTDSLPLVRFTYPCVIRQC